MGKLVLMVSGVTESFASKRITFLVRSSCQRSSSALMISTSSVVSESSRL